MEALTQFSNTYSMKLLETQLTKFKACKNLSLFNNKLIIIAASLYQDYLVPGLPITSSGIAKSSSYTSLQSSFPPTQIGNVGSFFKLYNT